MRQGLSTALLFGFVAIIGAVIVMIGIKQKRESDIIIEMVIIVGSLIFYFLEFF